MYFLCPASGLTHTMMKFGIRRQCADIRWYIMCHNSRTCHKIYHCMLMMHYRMPMLRYRALLPSVVGACMLRIFDAFRPCFRLPLPRT